MATYLVTGGAGFIGSHICDALLKDGHTVHVIDNFLTGAKENLRDGVIHHDVDLRDLDKIGPLFKGVDGVFHCAALPRVQTSIENPIETHGHNIDATLHVFVAARDAGVKRVVYSASSSAYGDGSPMPLREDMFPNPMSPYGLQKHVGEHYARLFALIYNLETVSLRYFNVYGPRMAEKGAYVTVMSVFVRQLREGKKLTITGDGTQTRDFTHVDDVVRANLAAMNSEKAGQGEIINIGAGANQSINDIAAMFGGETEYIPPRLEPHDTLADISLAKELLNWTPSVDIEEGIRQVKEFYNVA